MADSDEAVKLTTWDGKSTTKQLEQDGGRTWDGEQLDEAAATNDKDKE